MIDTLEDDGISLKIHIKDPVSDAEIAAGRQDDEFEEEHTQGSCECHCCQLLEALLLELECGEDVLVVGSFSNLSSSARKEDWSISLGQEGEWNERGSGVDETNPEYPAPSKARGYESRYWWCSEWANTSSLWSC